MKKTNTVNAAFMKKNPNFVQPKVNMDFTTASGSDAYAWRIVEVDANGKGFTAMNYSPKNKAVWPVQDWQFEDDNGQPLLGSLKIHCKFGYGRWHIDQHSAYLGNYKAVIHPHFGHRGYHQDPSF